MHSSQSCRSTDDGDRHSSPRNNEQPRHDRVEVLRVKFAEAAKLKAATKEKGVSWSTLECEDSPTDASQSSVDSAVNTANN